MGIKIDYYGHSCFVFTANGYRLAYDPYDGSVPGYDPLKLNANEVLCSHFHRDHNNIEAVTITEKKESPFTITEFDIPHDDADGTLRGMTKIRRFEADGVRIAHFGDVGCDLKPEYVDDLTGLDAIMVPAGGYYTIDAEKALSFRSLLKPRVFIPIHYRNGSLGYDVLSPISDFLKIAGAVKHADGNSIMIEKNMPEQTLILRYTGGTNEA